MGEHSLELVVVHGLKEAVRHRDRRMLGVASGRKCIRLRGIDQKNPGHRHLGSSGQVANDRVHLWQFVLFDRLGPGRSQGHLVGEEVGDEVEDSSEDQTDPEAVCSSEGVAERPHQSGQKRQESDGFEVVCHYVKNGTEGPDLTIGGRSIIGEPRLPLPASGLSGCPDARFHSEGRDVSVPRRRVVNTTGTLLERALLVEVVLEGDPPGIDHDEVSRRQHLRV